MMRVLVLGADGFVGSRTVAALAASDWALPVAGGRRTCPGRGVERIQLDATDPAALAQAVGRVDAVVNCVAGDAAAIIANGQALAGAAADRRIVHLSSMAVYGSATGVIDESAAPRADTGGYAAAKAEAERRLGGVADLVTLRPGCIYGPGSRQWSQRIADLLVARRIGDLGAAGDGCSNVVHVDDTVAAILAALRRADVSGQAFNLAMPDAPDWNGYFLGFARALGAVPIVRVPAWRLKLETRLAAVPLKLAERVSRRLPPPIPPSLARLWAQDIRLSSARASSMLAMSWTPLAEGLRGAADWYAGRPRSDA